MLRFLLQKSKQFIDISVTVIGHEKDMPVLKLGLRVTPFPISTHFFMHRLCPLAFPGL